MTILEPKKLRSKIKYILPLLGIIFAGAIGGVFFYSDAVNLRHQVKRGEKEFQELRVKNAELRDELYSLLDVAHLRSQEGAAGLVLEKSPEYLEARVQLLASTNQ